MKLAAARVDAIEFLGVSAMRTIAHKASATIIRADRINLHFEPESHHLEQMDEGQHSFAGFLAFWDE